MYDPAAHHSPTPAQLGAWDAARRQDIAHHQLARLERRRKTEDRATTTEASIDIEQQDAMVAAAIQQKRAEREARRRRRLAAAAAADSNAGADADVEADGDVDADADAGAVETIGGGEGERGAPTSVPSGSLVYTISVPTTSDAFAWYNYDDDDDDDGDDDGRQQRRRHTYETLDAAREAGVWSYPASANERARCEVFRDLWEKGYYMGGGIKFGGDWLVYPGACFSFFLSFFQLLTFRWFIHSYVLPFPHICVAHTPGDPLRYHSHFAATVQTSPSAPLRPMEVVAHGRLGTATKKAHLLCGWDPESREVTYISIEWAGFG